MKKQLFFTFLLFSIFCSATAQNCYWVFLTDKAGTTFDPYSYFDTKAIERYQINDANLYDISNYPLNEGYVSQVDALVTEEVGLSRWFNAVAVSATPEQVAKLRQLPFVREVVQLESNMHLARTEAPQYSEASQSSESDNTLKLHNQLVRMGAKHFRDKGIDGKGIRIAVFDGGFPQVNTHAAFKHLRDNHQIVKTWNFPNKKENVYGWNSHGLMTLSCIAGRDGKTDLGLATGSEFLLARTEVEAEPFKEEVWWQMAVEWADKNGAQIISSSLGYGKDRYFTRDMNGQSYVAKAANMAARKGILVCNSAGNEGDDKTWRTIITPSDADSVLCVGGINPSLTDYERTSFSSYGPSADGRQKPNVCAFAYAWTANTGDGDNKYHMVPGTSFSCPLVAGFAACALQSRPGIKTMFLFHEIEKSGDLYPYCDYTYGYGVPQAEYFTGERIAVIPTFQFKKTSDGKLRIIPLTELHDCTVFIKNGKEDGTIFDYHRYAFDTFATNQWFEMSEGNIITVNLNNYTESYKFNKPDASNDHWDIELSGEDQEQTYNRLSSGIFTYKVDGEKDEKKSTLNTYYMLGLAVGTSDDEMDVKVWSPAKRIGVRWNYYFCKSYAWGLALEYGHSSFRFDNGSTNKLDTLTNNVGFINWLDGEVTKHRVNIGELGLELYQRIRLRPLGIFHKGWHWDLGVYANTAFNVLKIKGSHNGDIAKNQKHIFRDIDALSDYKFNWGVTTRISRDWVGVYARYRLNGIGDDVAADKVLLPRLEVGLQLSF